MIRLTENLNIPEYKCSTCNSGLMIPDEDKLLEKSIASFRNSNPDFQDEEFYSGRFTCVTNCSNVKCQEVGIISGLTTMQMKGFKDVYYDAEEYHYADTFPDFRTVYEIKYVDPIVKLITVPSNFDKELDAILVETYSIFWNNIGSCANKLRVLLEALMNKLKVAKKGINKKGNEFDLSLHARIEEFKKVNPKNGNHLLAIKIVGNSYSHYSGVKYNRQDVIEAYEILEYVIHDIFDNREEKIQKLTDKILRGK